MPVMRKKRSLIFKGVLMQHMTDLFTYKAVRQVLGELKETDPQAYRYEQCDNSNVVIIAL